MLGIGQTLSHYRILEKIGAGGMGEVYRANDQKLGRDVAIKVLPGEFAKDADRVARFQREAKLLASLNHPNIAAIYGLEESEGTRFLVLELIEGDTLADRLKRGAIPVEESLKLALQIAEALEAAHEKGGKWQVSTSGGEFPLWSPDGRELFYLNSDAAMAVSMDTDSTLRPGTPKNIFNGPYLGWDISPDGKQFLLRKYPSDSSETKAQVIPNKINIVANWFEELKKQVPME